MQEGEAPYALVLFGPPGSGKGTQAKLVRDCLGIPHISTGDMLRDRIQQGGELGEQVRSVLEAGHLVSDELVDRLVEDRISMPDCANGFILDGYPRTTAQASAMVQALGARGIRWLVVHLKVDYNEIIRRLAARRSCVQCGAVFNLASNPPKANGICDSCGGNLGLRDDDRESVIRRRLDAYDAQTLPLLDFFSAGGHRLEEVNGGGAPPREIARRICYLVQNEVSGKALVAAKGTGGHV
ncbi:MAG: adenylate kinase [Acidobacteria bacterium]|nr:adenylate kinase [Acidobacteriota bacterium]